MADAPRERIQFEAHRPERRRRRGSVVAACCCTCCCCVHSLGGLVGAGIALARATPGLAPGEPAPRLGVLYWLVLQGLLGLSFVIAEDADTALFAMILLLPGLQLLTSLVCLIILACSSISNKRPWYRKLGRVTLWGFLGGLIGTGLMFLASVLL